MTILETGIISNLVCAVTALFLLHLYPSDQGITVTIALRTRFIDTRLLLSGGLMLLSSGFTIILILGYTMKTWRSLSA
jgi:hypothetical protein